MSIIFDFKVELPRLRSPIALIVDDPAPYVNHLYYLKKYLNPDYPDYYEEISTIPNSFLTEFVSLVKEQPVKGKFSVIPNPAGLGYIDGEVKGYPREGVEWWIRKVREELTAFFDITPEMITHTQAVDLETGRLLPMHEQVWCRGQTAETLTPYIAKALEVLKNVGFYTSGVTSPGAFGKEVEAEYAMAVLEAVKKVYGARLAWYFLKIDPTSEVVFPRLTYIDKHRREAVVSILSGNRDIVWDTMTPESRAKWNASRMLQYADYYVSEDGRRGRLVDLVEAGSYVIFHTHWNSLWSNGAGHGLEVLREVLNRINSPLRDKVIWMKLSEIANYYVASKSLDIHVDKEEGLIRTLVENPFPCQDLTVSFKCDLKVREAYLAKGEFSNRSKTAEIAESITQLKTDGQTIEPNGYLQKDGRVYVCFDNKLGNILEVRY